MGTGEEKDATASVLSDNLMGADLTDFPAVNSKNTACDSDLKQPPDFGDPKEVQKPFFLVNSGKSGR